jgi:hypothetical protein
MTAPLQKSVEHPSEHGTCKLSSIRGSVIHVGTKRVQDHRADGKPFAVTENLWPALTHPGFKERDDPRTSWVDAICLYVDRYQMKYGRNLRLGPLFSEGSRFALVGSMCVCLSIQGVPLAAPLRIGYSFSVIYI